MDDPLLAELLDLENDLESEDIGSPSPPRPLPSSIVLPPQSYSNPSIPQQQHAVPRAAVPMPSTSLGQPAQGPSAGHSALQGPPSLLSHPPSTSGASAQRTSVPTTTLSSQQAPRRVNPEALVVYLRKFSTLHWNMLFGALHRHDAGLKPRLEPIYQQGYKRLKEAAAAANSDAYAQAGWQIFRQLTELLPEDRLAGLMQKCAAHIATERTKRQQQQPASAAKVPVSQPPSTARPSSADAESAELVVAVAPPSSSNAPAADTKPPPSKARAATEPAAKRSAAGAPAGAREAKRARGSGSRGSARDRDGGDLDEILGADAFIDMEQETDTLMAGLHVQRAQGHARAAPTQCLSEWRLGNECMRQMKGAGLSVLAADCFELLQRAFHAHASALLRHALSLARTRSDVPRRAGGVSVTHDPRRGVLLLERAARATAEAKLAAEREALLKAAGSRRADEETKERALKAKAELAGRAQATAANAAIAATLGGKSGRWNRLDRWKDKAAGGNSKKDDGSKGTRPGSAEPPVDGSTADNNTSPPPAQPEEADGSIAGLLAAAQAQQRAAEEEEKRKSAAAAAEEEERKKSAAAAAAQQAGSSDAQGVRKLFGSGVKSKEEESETLGLPDLMAAMERDYRYAKSELLYRLRNKPLPS